MGSSMRFFAIASILLMLFVSTEIGVVEARTCASLSQRFKGPCGRNSNCASVCHTEGFSSGDCKGFRRRCFCERPC